uniref:Uncharacterized protein n=1 Tax=Tanacetum cinerariifolium TaxID=118510 RepID=A0A6L2MRZ5_TANCI|nr:hypothetical protein [Tanacetum cinerariifolium]
MAPLTFADTHNMIVFLTKSDASEGFDQIVEFLNAYMIQYALMVNATIYVSCIKQFCISISIKKSNDVVRLQAIERSMVRNMDIPSKFLMYPRFLQLMINAQVDDFSSHNTKYTSPALTQKDEDDDHEVSAKPTPPLPTPATTPPPPQQEHIPSPPQAESAQPSSPPQQQPSHTTNILMTLLNTLLETCATLTKQVANLEQDKISQAIEITKLKQRVRRRMHPNRGKIAELDADEDVTLVDAKEDMNAVVQGRLQESQEKVYHLDLEHAKKVLSMQDTDEAEPAEVEEGIEVVTAAKLMTEVVTTAATTITAAQVLNASAPRRRRGLVIQDPKETATASFIMHSEVKSKDKGKKEHDDISQEYGWFKMEFFKGMTYNDIRPNFEKHYNSIKAFLEEGENEIKEKGNKIKGDSLNQDAAKKQRIDEET